MVYLFRLSVWQIVAAGSLTALAIARRLSGHALVTVTRLVVTLVAVVVFCTAIHLAHSWWWWLLGPVAFVAGLALVLMVDGFEGDLGDAITKPHPATIRLIVADQQPPLGTVVYFPGVENGADITSEDFRLPLRPYMDVVLVEHPKHDWDSDEVFRQLLQFLVDNKLTNLHFVGQSYGSEAAVNFIRYYQDAGEPLGRLKGDRFVSVCGPNDISDVKSFIPLAWARYIKTGPVTNFLWPSLQALFGKLPGPKQYPAPGVSEDWVARHQYYMRHYPSRGAFAQFAALARNRGAQPGEFPGINALIMRTEGEDVFVKSQASQKLLAAFGSGSRIVLVPGIHANLVEEAPRYSPLIDAFLLQDVGVAA